MSSFEAYYPLWRSFTFVKLALHLREVDHLTTCARDAPGLAHSTSRHRRHHGHRAKANPAANHPPQNGKEPKGHLQ